ncbi:gibberellin 2-beta-dioxygenase 8 [Quercus suber]|uniref:Gibberellin 2-beta-dioxygenase 8 n=1 Tax=Quercus suber TaxID=58331 RepID=A0AAW0L748_QUESU
MQKLEEDDGEQQQQQQLKRLREASEESGCFRIVNHKIPSSLMSEMKKVVREVLDLPMEIKMRNTESSPAVVTWLPPRSTLFMRPWVSMIWPLLNLCAPFLLNWISPLTKELYAEAIHELAIDLGRMLAKRWPCQFRINKYNFTPETVGSSGVQIHTDSGFLTILQDDENVSGLEVMDKSGAFVSVDPWVGTLLVNLGDVAKAWSNGRFCNVKHRVQCKEACIRVSIASFLLGPKEEAVEAPPELVDSDNTRQFLPFTYEEYRKLRISTKLHAGEALQFVRINP